MPLSKGTRYGVVTRGVKKIRLAFRRGTNQVIEAKNLESGATHTPKEFAKDRKKSKYMSSDTGRVKVRS